MKDFLPKRVFFEQQALDYPLGQDLWSRFREENIPVAKIASHNRISGIPGKTPQEAYREAKATLVVGVRKTLKFEGCRLNMVNSAISNIFILKTFIKRWKSFLPKKLPSYSPKVR